MRVENMISAFAYMHIQVHRLRTVPSLPFHVGGVSENNYLNLDRKVQLHNYILPDCSNRIPSTVVDAKPKY